MLTNWLAWWRTVTVTTNQQQQRIITQLESIDHPRYELLLPITIEIQRLDNEYIVRFPPIDIFETGEDLAEIIKGFGVLLGDYYESLLRREHSLAVNLHQELAILKEFLGPK